MDSSSLLQLQSQRVNQSNEDHQLSVSKGLDLMPEYDRFNSTVECHDDKHLAELLGDSEQPKMDELKLSIPMPNFLIDPQDGQFTPYFERSPVSTPDQEYDEPHYFDHPYTSRDSSPDSVLSPLRSRATSIALKKLMETQAQMLLDISAAWKKKYPVDASDEAPRSTAHDEHETAAPCISSSSSSSKACEVPPVPTSATQPASLLPANPIFPSAQLPRKIRSMSQKSSVSLASLVDRLSLRDIDKSSLSADVESWKRDALQSKLKEQSTRNWIDCLPSDNQFDDPSQSL
ncbi:hypothetical protein PtA15_13A397 [Puccinia triticina]|uniref:Uncharacterized protein n=1 Tax=Puccinia triticina TaxID=208348 RepID=A0ABY7D2T3_9BASI|nr:uncharacterized protein PtA15_13A397 [Puccinia triticina]WAQ90997.1 hypothetical protein PtA15_13A397 [Puccinia triticina]WAR61186.1 hypothetical protein PtB15_13B438 [Puccinia triticina]